MYLGKEGKFIEYGGGVNILYGKRTIDYVDNGRAPDPNVSFDYKDLEDPTEFPQIGDLILNSDGCFYRISNIENSQILTTRVTLQGSGSTSGGGSSSTGTWDIYNTEYSTQVFASSAKTMILPFGTNYNGTDDNYIVKYKIEYTNEPKTVITEKSGLKIKFNEINRDIDIVNYKHLFDEYGTEVTLWVYDKYGVAREARFTIAIAELALEPYGENSILTSKDFTCMIMGGTTGVSNKTIFYEFYDLNHPDNKIGELNRENVPDPSRTGEYNFNLNVSNLNHGIYLLKIWSEISLSNSADSIKSNILNYTFVNSIIEDSPLFAVSIPRTAEAYTEIPIELFISSSDANKSYTISIESEGNNKVISNIAANQINTDETVYYEKTQTYYISFKVEELNLYYSTEISIVNYAGKLPTIQNTSDLMLYLNPRGYSNNRTDRNEWKDYYGSYKGKIEDQIFSQNAGWVTDELETYLNLTSGGTLTVSSFHPFSTDPTVNKGMTIELDFEVNGVTDYDASLISCLSTLSDTSIATGFVIKGNEIRFYNNRLNDQLKDDGTSIGALLTVPILEGKRTRITYVIESKVSNKHPMCYCYVNGKIAGIAEYVSSDSFMDGNNPAEFIANSTFGQIKLYSVRFYSTRHQEQDILNNYITTLPNLNDRKKAYEDNQVYDNRHENIDYKLVSNPNYNLQIPYMTLTGGYKTVETSKWKLESEKQIGSPGLPTDKKDYRMVNVEVVYPNTEQFKNYEKYYSFKNIFKNGGWFTDNYDNSPDNGGCIMYAQGTSSMEYPVKNLRIRWKNEKDFFRVKPDLAPVEIICMKADYMESSGSHNTGGGNLMDDMYERASLQTPGQRHFSGDNKPTIVTAIKGYPCLIFYRPDENSEYEYIGKYNLNLDKATPEPFGFNHDDSNFGYLSPRDPYYSVEYYYDKDKPEKGSFIGQQLPQESGDYIPSQTEEPKEVQEGEKINSIHCFEFLDNATEVCNFLNKVKKTTEEGTPEEWYDFHDTWYKTFKNKKNEDVPGWALGFESRYPDGRLGYHDADMLYDLASWLNELHYLKEEELKNNTDEDFSITDKIIEYNYKPALEYNVSSKYYIKKDDDTYVQVLIQDTEFELGKYYIQEVKNERFVLDSLERFKQEYQCYFNKEFLLFYYIMTEALLMVDSRTKNMMIATWGREERTYKDINSGENKTSNYYIWYPIFYDMDTMMGLDNIGAQRFKYYDNDDAENTYNGDEVLWKFVKWTLSDELAMMYNTLESALLNIDIDSETKEHLGLLPYFNKYQAEVANEAFYNGDAKYKYINPAKNDYVSPDGTAAKKYLYAAQGDRSLSRELFVLNRIKYLRGKYNSTDFKGQDRVNFRWGYPKGNITNELEAQSVLVVPPNGKFIFESLQPAYVGVQLGANGVVESVKFDREETKELIYSGAAQANGTESYILGVSNLKSFGDLSTKYMQKFIMPSSDNKIEELILGNPHKLYYNQNWAVGESDISLEGCKYLRKFQLQNCSAYTKTLDFSKCLNIETILLTGSGVTGLTLPENGALRELRIPSTVKSLIINTHPNLSANNFSIGGYDYGEGNLIGECPKGSDIPYGSYLNNYQSLQRIEVIDTPIDTYSMIKSSPINLSTYCIQKFNWKITSNDFQYCKPDLQSLDSNKQYYIYESGNGMVQINYNDITDSNRNKIYEKVELMINTENGNEIKTIPVLDYLSQKNPQKENSPITHAEALKGTIYIDVDATADKYGLYDKYHTIYPNVQITYSNKVKGNNPYNIIFYNVLNKADIQPDITIPYYQIMAPNEEGSSLTISDLVGQQFSFPQNIETIDTVYTFEYWQDANTGVKVDLNTVPTSDLILIPKFHPDPKKYTVNFYSDNESIIPYKSLSYEYGKTIDSNSEAPLYMISTKEDFNDLNNRYTFKGWIGYNDYVNKVQDPIFYEESYVVYRNLNLYPFFVKESTSKPLDFKYFKIDIVDTIEFGKKVLYNTGETIRTEGSIAKYTNSKVIGINEKYQKHLKGKITLPAKYNDQDIDFIGNFTNMENIAQVFFETGSRYVGICDNAFQNCSNLVQIVLPDTLRFIGTYSFYKCNLSNQENLNQIEYIGVSCFEESQLALEKLPDTVTYIGPRAFFNTKIRLSSLPDKVDVVYTNTFRRCANVNITTFGYDTESMTKEQEMNGLTIIGMDAFRGIGSNIKNGVTITIYNSINQMGKECFYDAYINANPLVLRDLTKTINGTNASDYFGTTKIDTFQ